MSVSGISTTSNPSNLPAIEPGSPSDSGNSDQLLGEAQAVADRGFRLSLKAKEITNMYAAAKEVR
jgi:hypothetical protein